MNLIQVGVVVCTLFVITVAPSWDPYGREEASNPGQRGQLESTIAFSSTRDNPPSVPPFLSDGEIYLMKSDGTGLRRLTNNAAADIFPILSPDGTRVIFESNRRRMADDPYNVSDLFIMNADGHDQRWLGRGGSATWSPDGKAIAFHASVSGKGVPATPYPGSATKDSDIFVVNLEDWARNKAAPRNLTNNAKAIDDDPDWSPDGQSVVFTSHAATDDFENAASAEIYTVKADGSGTPRALTRNQYEERAPAWSPDGGRIVFCCRRGTKPDFDICVMNADGTGEIVLTTSPLGDLTPSWSPDGKKIVFHRAKGRGQGLWDLWIVNADGGDQLRLSNSPGYTGFASWGQVRVR